MTFAALFETYFWKPIRNCPGRYVLRGAQSEMPGVEELTGGESAVSAHRVSAARDLVLVAALDDGCGIISYRRDDGSLLHTLNTPEGFQRKLRQLGLNLAEQNRFVA